MRSMQKVAGFLVDGRSQRGRLAGNSQLSCSGSKRERTRSAQTLQGRSHRKGRRASHQTKEGTTYQLSENEARRQGRQFKAGDKVEVSVNENNAIVDVHLEGEKGEHKFVTGKLVHVGKMKKEIKLQTAEGDQSFPLLLQETKTGDLPEGTEVTVELNEAGTVIDLHKGKHVGQKK